MAASLTDDPAFVIQEGAVICYRLFDVGDEIALDRAEERFRAGPVHRRVQLSPAGAQSLALARPPLDVTLGGRRVDLPAPCGAATAEVSARLFDFGAISVRFVIPITPGTTLDALVPLCTDAYDSAQLTAAARTALDALLLQLGDAIHGRHEWPGGETYTVISVAAVADGTSAAGVRESQSLARLLLGETGAKRISESERADVAKHGSSYFDDDVVVIHWNSAFVLDPSARLDVADVLEFATAQLMEFRYHDEMLDAELEATHAAVGAARRRPWTILWSPYAALARGVLRRHLETRELTERVESSLKVVGDYYLARVYQAALSRFRVPAWQQSVSRKQALVAQVYGFLKDQVDVRRAALLELAIVLLIVLDIVLVITAK